MFRALAPDGTTVALKLLHPGSGADPEARRRRFEREVGALLRLSHENLVRARGAGWDQGYAYLVMDLVEGEDMQSRLARGPLEPRAAVEVALGIARALAHAHARGVVHRDVKPANVILRPDGRAVLVDFGLVKDVSLERSRLTATGAILGTPGYWAPEQARGELARIGPATDVYGLGATLHGLLAGGPPFTGESLVSALAAVDSSPPPPLRSLRRDVDARLEALVLRCLAKSPEARFPTGESLAAALEELLAASRPTPGRRGSGPGPAVALVGAGCAAALAIVLLRRAESPRPPVPEGGAAPVSVSRSPPDAVEALWSQVQRETERAELLELLDRGVELAPADTRFRGARAEALVQMGRDVDARRDAELVIADPRASPHHRAVALTVRAASQRVARDRDGARRGLEEAIALDPAYPQSRTELALVRGPEERAAAITDLSAAIALGLGPGEAVARGVRGVFLLQEERPEEARPDLEAALAAIPPGHQVRARIESAAAQLPPAVPPRPHPQHDAIQSRAIELMQTDRFEEAVRLLDDALADHRDSSLYVLRSAAWGLRGDMQRSEEDAELAVRSAPHTAAVYSTRAKLRQVTGRGVEAIDDLWHALSYEPRQPQCWTLLAELLAEVGPEGDAKLAAARAAEVDGR